MEKEKNIIILIILVNYYLEEKILMEKEMEKETMIN